MCSNDINDDLNKEFNIYINKLKKHKYYQNYMIKDIYFKKPQCGSNEGIYIYYDEGKYIFIYFERGSITTRKETFDKKEILYWLLNKIISEISFDYELDNRKLMQDVRRTAFKESLEIFKSLKNGSMYERRIIEINEILSENPYDDTFKIQNQ